MENEVNVFFVISPLNQVLGQRLQALGELERYWNEDFSVEVMLTAFFNVFPEKLAAQQFLEACDTAAQANWPSDDGKCPFPETYDIASSLLRAHHPEYGLGGSGYERYETKCRLIQLAAKRWKLFGVVSRFDVNDLSAEKRWPRLVQYAKQAAILSHGEATSALMQWYRRPLKERLGLSKGFYGGEAVTHYGGVRKVILGALRWHRMDLQTRLRAQVMAASPKLGSDGSVDLANDVRLQSCADGKGGYEVIDTHFGINLACRPNKSSRRFLKLETAYKFALEASQKPWSTTVFEAAAMAVLAKAGARAGEPGRYHWVIDTVAGPLDVSVYEDWIATRYIDVAAAKSKAKLHGLSLNPFSGKWNFHADRCALRDLAHHFERAIAANASVDFGSTCADEANASSD